MVEPVAFGFNRQTAANNYFQHNGAGSAEGIQEKALEEFEGMVDALRNHGVEVITVRDTPDPHTPDSIFPNNWLSLHDNGMASLYPMYAENRRKERRTDILGLLKTKGFQINNIHDHSRAEKDGDFLEGTGSMVFDRENRIAYAAISERTSPKLLYRVCRELKYLPVPFHAFQTVGRKRLPIYHTNVMMSVADRYAVVCADSIDNEEERATVIDTLFRTGKGIIDLTEEQMCNFAGNMLQVENREGERLLVMSQSAYDSLREHQIENLKIYNEIVKMAIPTIEKYGGGSVRCMMAEVFLPRNENK